MVYIAKVYSSHAIIRGELPAGHCSGIARIHSSLWGTWWHIGMVYHPFVKVMFKIMLIPRTLRIVRPSSVIGILSPLKFRISWVSFLPLPLIFSGNWVIISIWEPTRQCPPRTNWSCCVLRGRLEWSVSWWDTPPRVNWVCCVLPGSIPRTNWSFCVLDSTRPFRKLVTARKQHILQTSQFIFVAAATTKIFS